jgi:hypothetical protein
MKLLTGDILRPGQCRPADGAFYTPFSSIPRSGRFWGHVGIKNQQKSFARRDPPP